MSVMAESAVLSRGSVLSQRFAMLQLFIIILRTILYNYILVHTSTVINSTVDSTSIHIEGISLNLCIGHRGTSLGITEALVCDEFRSCATNTRVTWYPIIWLLAEHICCSIIVYYSDIRTFIHKGYNTIFNLYVQPDRAYKSLWCSWTVNLRGNSIIYSTLTFLYAS